ncbi:hypothetical protein [Phaeobacter piscinae]|uniref:hypothetical protein n=1 Tax=Phaeobacter piscinae TaxID=1580596 RepID=UPI00058ED32C|nr:hypothetical protein [Phaeobacter piscinae]UTS82837.1 hypothetical protein OL67_003947 [Phaeobacter piscinae]
MTDSTYATDPTTLRSEARDIEIGAPDGDGYAGWLRACADKIEELEEQNAQLLLANTGTTKEQK